MLISPISVVVTRFFEQSSVNRAPLDEAKEMGNVRDAPSRINSKRILESLVWLQSLASCQVLTL